MRWLMPIWVALWVVFSIPWVSATTTPQWNRIRPPRVRAASRIRPDHMLNVLFYVPVAPIGSTLRLPLQACLLAGSAMSLTAEASQVFSFERNPDWNDVIANIAGTGVGALGVWVYRRRRRKPVCEP